MFGEEKGRHLAGREGRRHLCGQFFTKIRSKWAAERKRKEIPNTNEKFEVAKHVNETSEREEKKSLSFKSKSHNDAKMARNEEKAQSMLNRWWAFKSGDLDKKERKRPYLASKCNNTIACEKWRLQILHEIGQKVQEIQSGTSATPFN